MGRSWQSADGETLEIPITDPDSPCLVQEYHSKNKNVYLKDMGFDHEGHPLILYLVSNGPGPGPDIGDRIWKIAYWTGNTWQTYEVCTSDHNYDMGSLYVTKNTWCVVVPSAPGPQRWGTGGDVEIWESTDQGEHWNKIMQVTGNSQYNHSYIRRPVNANKDFYAFWADGDPYHFSKSHLFFMDKDGNYNTMPYEGTDYPFIDNEK